MSASPQHQIRPAITVVHDGDSMGMLCINGNLFALQEHRGGKWNAPLDNETICELLATPGKSQREIDLETAFEKFKVEINRLRVINSSPIQILDHLQKVVDSVETLALTTPRPFEAVQEPEENADAPRL